MSYLNEYFGIVGDKTETAVCCPFDHYTGDNIAYKETHPSAHINVEEGLFHCKACGRGFNELQFIQETLGCDYVHARKIQQAFETDYDITAWDAEAPCSAATLARTKALGVSEKVIKALHIGTPPKPFPEDMIAIPVFMFGHLIDIRYYNPGHTPKIRSTKNAVAGLIIPFDIWQTSDINKTTLICAGEKDMMVARSQGLNAITLTGGEHALPTQAKYFQDRKIVILYDNDDTGIQGAQSLANFLSQYTKNIRVVTGFHEVCKEKGEDITDFFVKYKKTKQDLIKYIRATPIFKPVKETVTATKDNLETVSLYNASTAQYVNKLIKTNIQVVATMDQTFVAPTSAVAEKTKSTGFKDTLAEGTIKEWQLTKDNLQDLLYLVDNNFTETQVKENLQKKMHIPKTERCVSIKTLSTMTVFKAVVTDLFETNDVDAHQIEYTCYSLGVKLESGKKYKVTHKLIPHPYKGQQLVMVVLSAEQASDSVTNFKITPEIKEDLAVFQQIPGTAEEKVNAIAEKVKGLLGYNGNLELIKTIDLSYHTVLQFNFGTFKNVRGYLDTLIVGESRMGKSSTAEILKRTYGLGTFVSLAGNSATIPGLVGGSNRTVSGFQTRAGIIPQNHKGLVIFEELGKCATNVLAELTDIRSSNEVRINRVSGTLTLPAYVRMISLTNVKHAGEQIKPIAAYPNGIAVIAELVPTAEDIARYDIMLVLGDKGNESIDPLWVPEEPFTEAQYRTRVRWIWSRTADQVILSEDIKKAIVQAANNLNNTYGGHIKIFGTEAWKKITRLAIAIAGYCVSTDSTYEKLIVKRTHVDYAVKFFVSIYDNKVFRLREYIAHERKYAVTDDNAKFLLQDIYDKTPSLISQLEQNSCVTKNMLSATTGLTNEELNRQLNRLTQGLFIKVINFDILPTERFRLTLNNIERNTKIPMIGVMDV